MAEVTVKPYQPNLVPVDYDPFYEATSADKPAFQPTAKLIAKTLFDVAPLPFKPTIAALSNLSGMKDAFMEGVNKSGAAGLKSMGEALENMYVPEGAVSFNDAGEYLDKDGKVLKSQYRPNILPWTRGEGGTPEFAMPAMADVWNTLGGPAGLGAGPSLRPALKYMDKIYKAKQGEQHLDAIPAELRATFEKQALSGEDISNFNFGFINHKGHFLQREDALKYAIDHGILDPNDAKYGTLVTTMLNQSGGEGKLASTFFSALENTVKEQKQAKASGDQWLSTLQNAKGVKGEEIEWTGLKDFLAGKQSVTKQEIQDYLKNNKVELGEVWKGKSSEYNALFDEHYKLGNESKNIPPGPKRDAMKKRFDELSIKLDELEKTNPTKYHDYQLPGGPLSRDTEILTNKSWKRIDEIEIGDVIMTRKDEGGILEWQPVLAAPKVYAENLYHFFNQSVDMLVTENHQMVVKKRRRNKKGIFRTTAKELWKMSECVIPLTGVWTGKGNDKILNYNANDVAEFIGWYLAEGSYKQHNGVKNTIQIAQCRDFNPEKCNRLEALFNRLGFSWKYYGDAYGLGIKSMNKDLIQLLHSQPKSDGKYIPEFFFNESKSVIQSLLDGLILGDGCTIRNQPKRFDKVMYFTKSKRLAGDVQALILMIGKRASVRQRPSGLYCVGINRKEWSSVDDAKYEIAPYNDFAFCVTVENHSIYVRRNGVAAFTGNTNYRELLMTLPTDKGPYGQAAVEAHTAYQQQLLNKYGNGIRNKATPEELAHLDDLDNRTISKNPAYKSSHWDEPNILAHMRMNDRTIDGKKSLHLEEIQSDWHQQGREKGYKGQGITAEDKAIRERLRTNTATEADYLAWDNGVGAKFAKDTDSFLVPDAPFKKTWHELALKRAIREAAENGYERLSWTPGEAQAARYDLSKQVQDIGWNKSLYGPDTIVRINPKDGKTIALQMNEEGKIVESNPRSQASQFEGKTLSDVVGKEIAEKILNKIKNPKPYEPITEMPKEFSLIHDRNGAARGQEWGIISKDQSHARSATGRYHATEQEAIDEIIKQVNDNKKLRHDEAENSLSNLDLRIGDEGMKGFYDQIIPKSVEKIAKEFGVKIQKGEVVADKEGWHITPPEQTTSKKWMVKSSDYNSKGMHFDTKAEAEKALAEKLKKAPIFYIDIPENMRKSVKEKGQPLFSGTPTLTPIDYEPEFEK